MLRWAAARLSWMLLTLLGVTFVTFAVFDLAPVDRAELVAAARAQQDGFVDRSSRDRAILQLRLGYGTIDATTLAPAPLWQRYGRWLQNASSLRFAGPHGDHAAFWRRLAAAAPVSAWLGLLAVATALLVGVPLGTWLGLRAGSRADAIVSQGLFLCAGVPEFLLATLLLLGFGGVFVQWFPVGGLRSAGAAEWPLWRQLLDFGWHLTLPVAVMASGPVILVTRLLRDSVARTAELPFVQSLRALGAPPALVRRRILRSAAAPLATLVGSLLPMLVGGSIVVENLFSLDGLGHLAVRAVFDQDQAMVMALVVVTSATTLVALMLSDLLHRLVDPRVRLVA
jgi:ABC-type dipeptide/oligopeptide/nickel transport system permease component